MRNRFEQNFVDLFQCFIYNNLVVLYEKMKQSNCTSIKVLLVLLTQLLVIQAGCLWDTMSQTQCAISCTSSYSFNGIETPQQVLAILEQRWNEVRRNEFLFLNLMLNSILSHCVHWNLACRLSYRRHLLNSNWHIVCSFQRSSELVHSAS